MVWKYSKEIDSIRNCPPEKTEAPQTTAYRFVHSDITDERNFLPVAILKPKRRFEIGYQQCISLSLSLFQSAEQAKFKYTNLKKAFRNIHKSIGTHLAKGEITPDDGSITEANNEGHFSLFESTDADFASKFEIIEEF